MVRLDGLDTLRPIARQKLVVTAKTLDEIQKRRDANEAARRLREGTGTLQLALGAAPKLDGDLSDWDAATFVSIEKRGVGAYFNADNKPYDISGALRATKTDLYAAWRTEGVNALAKNSGENPECLFKTGGGLDIMLDVHGGIRLDRRRDPEKRNDAEGKGGRRSSFGDRHRQGHRCHPGRLYHQTIS